MNAIVGGALAGDYPIPPTLHWPLYLGRSADGHSPTIRSTTLSAGGAGSISA